jgi:hypothetical protein
MKKFTIKLKQIKNITFFKHISLFFQYFVIHLVASRLRIALSYKRFYAMAPSNAVHLCAFLMNPERKYQPTLVLSQFLASLVSNITTYHIYQVILRAVVNCIEVFIIAKVLIKFISRPYDIYTRRNAFIFALTVGVSCFVGSVIIITVNSFY